MSVDQVVQVAFRSQVTFGSLEVLNDTVGIHFGHYIHLTTIQLSVTSNIGTVQQLSSHISCRTFRRFIGFPVTSTFAHAWKRYRLT